MPDALELVYLEPRCAARVRKQAVWQEVLADAEEEGLTAPFAPGIDAPEDDLRDAFAVLARGAPTDGRGVQAALVEAVRPDGKAAPPVVLVEGELAFSFDEVAALRGYVTTATPFLGGDEPLTAAVQAGKQALASADAPCPPALAETLVDRIRDVFSRGRRNVPAGYLEAQTERALAEQRAYTKRLFLGAPCARALLHVPGDRSALLTYVPEAALAGLPITVKLQVRLVASVHAGVDHLETQPFALLVGAMGRAWERR